MFTAILDQVKKDEKECNYGRPGSPFTVQKSLEQLLTRFVKNLKVCSDPPCWESIYLIETVDCDKPNYFTQEEINTLYTFFRRIPNLVVDYQHHHGQWYNLPHFRFSLARENLVQCLDINAAAIQTYQIHSIYAKPEIYR